MCFIRLLAKIRMKKSCIAILLQILIVSVCFAQQNGNFEVDTFAEFKGGDLELRKYIANKTNYPKNAEQYCISGRVYVNFIVDSLGNVDSAKALNSLGYGCDEEAIRVLLSTSGKWKPGIKDNKPINMSFSIPVIFKAIENCKPYYFKYLEAGDKLFEKNKFNKAILQYDKIIEIRPYNPDALFKRGLSKLNISDTTGACYDWYEIPKLLNDKAKDYLLKYCEK